MFDNLLALGKRLGRPVKSLLWRRAAPSAPPAPFTPGDEAIIFLHIPKAAGTTLHLIMRRLYPADTIYKVTNGIVHREAIERFRALTELERRRIRVLHGHFPFGLHADLPGKSTYITLLRDPVERILSSYYYILRSPDHFRHAEVAGGKMSLLEYAETESIYLNNGQTALCAGSLDIAEPRAPRELLERAVKNLEEHFAVVGLTERFDESLALIRQRFRWPQTAYRSANITAQRPRQSELAPAVLQRLREMNQLDLELYEWAARRFQTQSRAAA